jgi:hypothetical protein
MPQSESETAMQLQLDTLLHSAFATGAVSGLLSAAAVDFSAFRAWKSFKEAATYDWGIAAWRWAQGFVAGGLAATVFRAVG